MDDEGELVDLRLLRAQVADGGRPVEPGDQVQVRVLRQRQVRRGANGDEHGLDGRGGPGAQRADAVERRHQGDEDARAAFREVGHVLVGGVFDDDGLAIEAVGREAAHRRHVAGQHVRPGEGRGRDGTVRPRRRRVQPRPRKSAQAVDGRAGDLLERHARADARQVGHPEVRHRVGVPQRRAVPHQGVGQADVVEAGHHEDPLLGEDAGLAAVGEDDRPALEPVADGPAVDQGRAGRRGTQLARGDVRRGWPGPGGSRAAARRARSRRPVPSASRMIRHARATSPAHPTRRTSISKPSSDTAVRVSCRPRSTTRTRFIGSRSAARRRAPLPVPLRHNTPACGPRPPPRRNRCARLSRCPS